MIATFRNGATGIVVETHWSPAFTTALVVRPDNFRRVVFFDRNGLHADPYVLRLVEARPKLECVA